MTRHILFFRKISTPTPDIENTMLAQVFDAPRKFIESLIANEVITVFMSFLCTSITCTIKRISISGVGLTISLLLTLSFTHAENFDIYKTSILVNDTQANDPLKINQAFAQIIANNTGEKITSIVNNTVFATANVNAGIKRSYFEKIDNQYLSEASTHHYWFYLVMQEKFIKKIIRQAGFSLLPHHREKIMLWSAIKQEVVENEQLQSKPLEYANQNKALLYWLNHWSIALGLNTVTPKYDELDKTAVTPSSIKNLSFEAEEQSIKRYDIDQTLLVYLKQNSETLKIRTGYKTAGSKLVINHFQESTPDLGVVLYSVLSDVSQRYANKYKIKPNQLHKHTAQIVINALTNYDNVNSAINYLSNLSIIEKYTIVSASFGQIVITAELSISNQAFKQIIKRDKLLSYDNNVSINQLVFNYVNLQ